MTDSCLICRICGNKPQNKGYSVREMMLGFKEEFRYFQCSECACLQIEDIPEDTAKYYPPQYYSFTDLSDVKRGSGDNPLWEFLKRRRTAYLMYHRDILGRAVSLIKPLGPPFSTYLTWLKKCNAKFDSKILDVGCGKGNLLLNLSRLGFRDLQGIDCYIDRDIIYNNGPRIFKEELSYVEGKYDVIMLHHSIEHMAEQQLAFKNISRLLKEGGCALIRTPNVSSYAWESYGVNWVQIDAPRHFFIHSLRSIQILADKAGLKVKEAIYDSTEFQFLGSEQYKQGISLLSDESYCKDPKAAFTEERIDIFRSEAEKLNKAGLGDQFCVYLVKR